MSEQQWTKQEKFDRAVRFLEQYDKFNNSFSFSNIKKTVYIFTLNNASFIDSPDTSTGLYSACQRIMTGLEPNSEEPYLKPGFFTDYPEQWTEPTSEGGGGLTEDSAKWLYSRLTESKHDSDAYIFNNSPTQQLKKQGFIKARFCTGDWGGKEFDGYDVSPIVFEHGILELPEDVNLETLNEEIYE
jgi:hypothetical protein